MNQYFVAKNGQQSGPFTLAEIVSQLGCATLSLTDYIYDNEKLDWILLMSHEKLNELLNEKKPSLPPNMIISENKGSDTNQLEQSRQPSAKAGEWPLLSANSDNYLDAKKERLNGKSQSKDQEASGLIEKKPLLFQNGSGAFGPHNLPKNSESKDKNTNGFQENKKPKSILKQVQDAAQEPLPEDQNLIEQEITNEDEPLPPPVAKVGKLDPNAIAIEDFVEEDLIKFPDEPEGETTVESNINSNFDNISASQFELPKINKVKILDAFDNASNCVYQAKLNEIKNSEGSDKEKAIKFSKALEEVVDPLMSEWYLLKDNNKYGPYTYKDMLNMLDQKFIYGFDFVWHKSLSNWRRIADLEAFSYESISKLKNTYMPELTQVYYRRRHKRVNYGHSILVHDNNRVWKANSVQIGEGGVGVIMEQGHVVPGQVVYLHFQPGDGVPPFNAVCEVVSKRLQDNEKDKSAKVFYGMKFQKISNNISQLVESLSKKKVS